MGNRIFVGVVVVLWAGTMSWLMVARILPPFFHGDPPTHGALIRGEPTCWEIVYGDKPVGHAVSQAVPGASGTTEIHSRVLLEGIEVKELAPQWMSGLVRVLGEVSLDTRSTFALDSLGNLSSFNTKVRLNDLPIVMRVQGKVVDAELKLKIQSGDVTHEVSYPVPAYSGLTNELIPDPKLLQVYVGRKWQQEVYSPFRPPGNSLEICRPKWSKNAASNIAASGSTPEKSSIAACRPPACRPIIRFTPWSGLPTTAWCFARTST